MTTFRVNHGQMLQADPISQRSQSAKARQANEGQRSFQDILDSSIKEKSALKVSWHAAQRLEQRNIKLDEADMELLQEAVEKAEKKGARDSLLLYKDLALLASVKNKTIITAVDARSAQENIFTNIDSAVLVRS